MTSLRDIIRPRDAEAARFAKARALSAPQFRSGEAAGVDVASLAGVLDFGLCMAWRPEQPKGPPWALEMLASVRRALESIWEADGRYVPGRVSGIAMLARCQYEDAAYEYWSKVHEEFVASACRAFGLTPSATKAP